MAQKYICDSCGKVIDDPYDVRMREFFIDAEYDLSQWWYRPVKHKCRIHLCDGCFKGLNKLADKKKGEK